MAFSKIILATAILSLTAALPIVKEEVRRNANRANLTDVKRNLHLSLTALFAVVRFPANVSAFL